MSHGATFLTREQVMEDVADMISDVQVEATFPDWTKLVTVHSPQSDSLGKAGNTMKAGGYILRDGPVLSNTELETRIPKLVNHGDRPIQVGALDRFTEVNPHPDLDRVAALGFRPGIPA